MLLFTCQKSLNLLVNFLTYNCFFVEILDKWPFSVAKIGDFLHFRLSPISRIEDIHLQKKSYHSLACRVVSVSIVCDFYFNFVNWVVLNMDKSTKWPVDFFNLPWFWPPTLTTYRCQIFLFLGSAGWWQVVVVIFVWSFKCAHSKPVSGVPNLWKKIISIVDFNAYHLWRLISLELIEISPYFFFHFSFQGLLFAFWQLPSGSFEKKIFCCPCLNHLSYFY